MHYVNVDNRIFSARTLPERKTISEEEKRRREEIRSSERRDEQGRIYYIIDNVIRVNGDAED